MAESHNHNCVDEILGTISDFTTEILYIWKNEKLLCSDVKDIKVKFSGVDVDLASVAEIMARILLAVEKKKEDRVKEKKEIAMKKGNVKKCKELLF
jgi:hypothetical protein